MQILFNILDKLHNNRLFAIQRVFILSLGFKFTCDLIHIFRVQNLSNVAIAYDIIDIL